MKIVINENQLKKLIDGELEEIVINKKRILGSGMSHEVYESNKYPDRVFKIGLESSVKEAYEFFKNYPYLFPHVYGYKKWGEKVTDYGSQIFLLVLEKLDTQRFIKFWNKLNRLCIDVVKTRLQSLSIEYLHYQEEWVKIIDYLEENDYELYEQTLEYFTLLKELNEIYDMPDVHNAQFGYDKNGDLKCLDF